MELSGRCLCGSVTFTAEVAGDEVGACHCSICRRQASGPQFAVLASGPVAFEGETHVARYRSSDWAERGFCARCGSKLFFRLVEPDLYLLSLGALGDPVRWRFVEQVFTDDKPGYYDFANKTRMLTGAEAVAKYVPRTGDNR